jgi:hypothetical protein
MVRHPAMSAHVRCRQHVELLVVENCFRDTHLRPVFARYFPLCHPLPLMRWEWSKTPLLPILLPCCNKFHILSLRILCAWLTKSPIFQYRAHTNRWRVTPVDQNYQLKGANDPFLSGVHQHNETALCRTFTTWFTSKQRRDPGTADRETIGEALGDTVAVSHLAICPVCGRKLPIARYTGIRPELT